MGHFVSRARRSAAQGRQGRNRLGLPDASGAVRRSHAGDAATARLIIDAQGGPVILVGHSYGGAVITEAGTDPNVAALVYIAAFVPDQGESVNTLIAGFPQDGPQPPILPPTGGFLFLDRESSTTPSPVTCPPGRPRSWPTHRSRGGGRARRNDH